MAKAQERRGLDDIFLLHQGRRIGDYFPAFRVDLVADIRLLAPWRQHPWRLALFCFEEQQMTQVIELSAQARARVGKGVARQTRRDGRIPAVIYGGKQEPVTISLEKFEFNRVLHQPGFFTHLFDVTVDGALHRVLPRDVQFHPVTDVPLHVDFLRVTSDTRTTVNVPIEFVDQDKSPGLKRGGVLNIVRHELVVSCATDSIPEHITASCAGFDVGDSIHISMVTLPPGVSPTITDRDFTIATIVAPSGLKSEESAIESSVP